MATDDAKDVTMVEGDDTNVEMVEAPVEAPEEKPKKKGKKKLICRLKVVENDGTYKAGEEYKGKNHKHLLKRKAIYEA